MKTVILALVALGLATPTSKPTTAKAARAKRTKRGARARKPPAPPLTGSAKTLAIQKTTGLQNVKVKKVFKVGIDELSAGVKLNFNGRVALGGAQGPDIRVARGKQVRFTLSGKPGAVYFADCGIRGANQIEHELLSPGSTAIRGVASVTASRALFAHTFDVDDPTSLSIVVRDANPDSGFNFDGCEITELAPAQVKRPNVSTGTATAQ